MTNAIFQYDGARGKLIPSVDISAPRAKAAETARPQHNNEVSNVTPVGAARLIAMAAQFIEGPRRDISYAERHMDTCRAQDWLLEAGDWITCAEGAFLEGNYEQAVAYAEAARSLAGTA